MIDISRHIECGESLVSMVIGKVLMSTPETEVENLLNVMVEASNELDVVYFVDSRKSSSSCVKFKLSSILLCVVTAYIKQITSIT